MKRKKHKPSAFTLIELLVVIAFIAILAALAVPALTSALTKAQMADTMINARRLYLAQFQMSNDGRATGDASSVWPGDLLEKIFINMDSRVLRNYFSKQKSLSVENKELAEKKYISSVYFHTIFLFSITKNRKYELKQRDRPVDVGDYLKDVFSSYYGEFLLNFGSEQLMASLAD